MRAVTGLRQHFGHVAADGDVAAFDQADLVGKVEVARHLGNGSLVARGLPVVLVAIFQPVCFDGAHGARGEAHEAEFGLERQIAHVNVVDDGAQVGFPPVLGHHATEVLDVQRAAEALAAQHGVVAQLIGNAAIAEHVGEVQLAAGLQHAVDLGEDLVFERRQVDDAVRHHQIDRVILDAELGEVFDEARAEIDVRDVEAEATRLFILVFAGDVELGVGHVDADDAAGRSYQLRKDIHVATHAAAQIDHGAALERGRDGAAATVEAVHDLVGDIGHHVEHVFGRRVGGAAARVGFQVVGAGENAPVVLADLLVHGKPCIGNLRVVERGDQRRMRDGLARGLDVL